MGWMTFDGTRIGNFSWDLPDPTECMTAEEEAALEAAQECQCCDHGRVLVFYCAGVCECGRCPDVEDCPECVGHIAMDELDASHDCAIAEPLGEGVTPNNPSGAEVRGVGE